MTAFIKFHKFKKISTLNMLNRVNAARAMGPTLVASNEKMPVSKMPDLDSYIMQRFIRHPMEKGRRKDRNDWGGGGNDKLPSRRKMEMIKNECRAMIIYYAQKCLQ